MRPAQRVDHLLKHRVQAGVPAHILLGRAEEGGFYRAHVGEASGEAAAGGTLEAECGRAGVAPGRGAACTPCRRKHGFRRRQKARYWCSRRERSDGAVSPTAARLTYECLVVRNVAGILLIGHAVVWSAAGALQAGNHAKREVSTLELAAERNEVLGAM